MKAHELVKTKILFQWQGKEEIIKCFVKGFDIVDGDAIFTLVSIAGKKFLAKNGEFNFDANETEVETNIRRTQYGMVEYMNMYNELDEETKAKWNELMNSQEVIQKNKERFEELKAKLIEERLDRSKTHRQYYHEGKFHVFYDIVNGNNVDRFMTMEEIEDMKFGFENGRRNPMGRRNIIKLDHLQAFDAEGNLVLDEWRGIE